jgi:hypothetical protein
MKKLGKNRRRVQVRNDLAKYAFEPLEVRTLLSGSGAYHLVFGQAPTGGPAFSKTAPSITVEIEDDSGNLVTSGSPTITLSVNNLNATNLGVNASLGRVFDYVLGSFSAVAKNGIAVFNDLIPTTVGEFSYTASDGSDPSVSSDPFAVTPADVHVVFVQEPGNVIVGAAISPTVKVELEDSAGNPLSMFDDDQVILLAVPPTAGDSIDPGFLFNFPAAHPVNGVATFSGLSVSAPGTYKLEALLYVPGGLPIGGPIFSPGPIVAPGDTIQLLPFPNVLPVIIPVLDGPTLPQVGSLFDNPTQDIANGLSDTFNAFPNAMSFARQPVDGTAGFPISPGTVVDLTDANGKILTSDNSPVTLTVTSGPAGANIGQTFTVNAVNGVAVFRNLVFDIAGTYTLTASDEGATVASQAFTVHPGAVASLQFTQQPANAIAGAVIGPSIVVSAFDAFGNAVASNQAVTLSVASGPAGAILGGQHTVNLVNGVATFGNVNLTVAGNYTLKAATGSVSTTSSNFTVSEGSPAHLAFIQMPLSGIAGQSIGPIVVQVTDQFGNLVTNANGVVFLYIGSVPTNGAPFFRLVSALQNGLAVFNEELTVAGRYTFSATLGPVSFMIQPPPVVQSPVLIIHPAAAAQIVVASQPVGGTKNKTLAPLTVNVEDQYGNLVTDVSQISISLLSGPPGGVLGGTLSTYVNNGIAVFHNLFVSVAGDYVLSITDGLLPAVQTGKISVN